MNNVLELRQLWHIIQKHFFALIFMAIIGACAGYGVAKFVIAPTYSASTSMLVNRSADDTSTATANLSDQQADVQLINTYKNLIISSNVLGTVSDELENPAPIVVQKAKDAVYDTLADGTRRLVTPAQKEITKPSNKKKYYLSVDELKSMVTISSQQNSQVFSINVKSKDPKLAADVANEVADVFKDKIGGFMKINNVSIIDSAKANKKPVSPNTKLFTWAGLVVVGGLTFLYMLIKELADTTIKSPDEVSQLFGMTNLGVIGHVKPIKNFSMAPSSSSAVKVNQSNGTQRSRLSRLDRE
ncbi:MULTISPECIES: YveK family protein [Leuconostoc]|uniref:YveK family protein n=1 Tax=Leuconostoc TaxID=1243 RepID=UPI0009B6C704|nr:MULTISPECIES: Wzz/FepE/Etk N-terminal domain-containing protein [Leuconostoc]OQJ70453.1 capsular biosynthesis protein [Leuconostoc pseudomesenteroides]MDG9744689.1 Wzz/FepE/Etk N-terminal domain-containing protein [Leuconostoc falkenbergense]ORI50182.1 capsular biosynthesis protein [Leuconostoc pseudomesenteroides]ORI56938.1 capsular biosynthesis protein [Leuconostoc pseudomesenteroides]ORI71776.1 capsular biosynthesis protein [Leuconostoc pseudomesenteroides]